MTPQEHLTLLGPDLLAEIRRTAAAVARETPPPPELLEELRPVLAPAMQRARDRQPAEQHAA